MVNAQNYVQIEREITGASLLYGNEAIKAIEKEGTISFKTPKGNTLWNHIKSAFSGGNEASAAQMYLVGQGHSLKNLLKLQDDACSLEALPGRVSFLRDYAAREEAIREKAREIEELKSGVASLPDRGPQIMTSAEILSQDFPEPEWVIPNILPVGTSILAGPPKKGKSWMVLNWAVALTSGGLAMGKIPVEQQDVLYLALEDFPRRIKARLEQISARPSNRFRVAFDWRRGVEGAADLDLYLENNPEVKFVIIDTLEKFRAPQTGNRIYSDDYEAIGLLKKISDKRGVGLLVVHHTRKNEGNDPLEQVSGSFGLTGAADNILLLSRGKGQADSVLYVTGRDIEEKELALKFDPQTGWDLLGDAQEYTRSKERQEVLDVLREADGDLSPKEIADLTGKTSAAIKMMLARLVKEKVVEKVGYGKYKYSADEESYSVTLDEKTPFEQGGSRVTPEIGKCYSITPAQKSNKSNFQGVTSQTAGKQGFNAESNRVTQNNNIDIFALDFG